MKSDSMKKLKMLVTHTFNGLKSPVIALALLLAAQAVAVAGSTPFSQVIAFGDSLTDNGTGFYAAPPNFQGRYSDGIVWVEYLAQDLGMAGSLDDYAVSGAATVDLQGQIGRYLSSNQGDPDALYILWAGHNDLFRWIFSPSASPETVINNGVQNTLQAVQTLRNAGARQIVVVSLADVGTTPVMRWAPISREAVSALCVSYNQALEAALRGLETAGVPTIRIDGFGWFRNIVASPEEFGFTNATDEFLWHGFSANADPAEYFFWDSVHPTTRAHRFMADIARNGLIDYYSPRNGKSHPPALVNALNGLARAK
jgi:thermolabile hemolysin